MPPDRQMPYQGPRNSLWQRAKGRLPLTVALSTIQVTVHIGSRFHFNFKGGHLGMVRGLPPTSREDLSLDDYLEYLHAAKVLNIYKQPCLLLDSNPGPTYSQRC
ncbi:hypothetical protein TNCV_1284321 [Trichonephila clavipes]|uniref:Uncharacterized protein n=1 Tax=Trichonephila clavipes TaxID=2585209 RepID=A0A8X6VER1_TRICX|nr:hypothetical protein TNCV_1284321 [Trichonephila clavipes]